MKGTEVFQPINFNNQEENTTETPKWVKHIRTNKDGREVGFEKEPTMKHGYWQGGGRWVVLSK